MAIPTGIEILFAGSVGGGAAIIGWFAKQVVEMRDGLRAIKSAVYGDEDSKVAAGLIVRAEHNSMRITAVEQRVGVVEGRLGDVENTCVVMHGNVIVRPQEP